MSPLTMERQETKDLTREPLVPKPFDLDFGLMRRFGDEMDRLFEDFGFRPRFFARAKKDDLLWMPDVEILERENEFLVRADLPGLTKDDVKVNVTDDVLELSGERKQATEIKREGYFRTERSYGSFYRTIPLPEGVKADAVQAVFKNGVLEITMPLIKPKKTVKNVDVKVG